MSEVRFARAAEADLDEIWRYIAERNRAAAATLVRRIELSLKRLAENPLLGESWDHRVAGLKRFSLVGNYVAYFLPQVNGIEVARIVHGARDVDAVFPEATPN